MRHLGARSLDQQIRLARQVSLLAHLNLLLAYCAPRRSSAQGEEQHTIYYYDSAEAYRAFAEPQGELDLHGATVDLAKVSGDFFDPDGELHLHFTLRTTDRELHLRIMEGSRISEYEAWLKALAAAGVTILEGAVKRHLLTSSTFKALQVQLELRRKDDERTLRQVAGLSPAASVTSSLTGSMKDLFKLGTPTPPPSSVEPLDIAQLDSALERSRVSGVHPRVIQQAKLRRSASMGSGKFGGALGDGSSPHPMPGSMPSSSGGSSSGDAAAPPKRTNEQLMMDTYNSWGCSAQSCAVM